MKKRRILYIFICTLVVSVLFLAGGISYGQKATPEKDVEVVVGTHRDFTGPISAVVVPIWKAFDWHLAWLEQNDPIPGVNVKTLWEDTAYSAERFLPTYKKFKHAGAVIQIHTSSTANSVLGELHRMDKIPALTPGCGYLYGYFPKKIKKKGIWCPSKKLFKLKILLFGQTLFRTRSISEVLLWMEPILQ